MTASKRKPYLQLKLSAKEFFTAPVRLLKETNMIESAFEKPYLTDEYPTMHLDLPTPDWPTWKFTVDPLRMPKFPWSSGLGGEGATPVKAGDCPCCFFLYWGDCDNKDRSGGDYFTIFHPEYPLDRFEHRWLLKGAVKEVFTYPPTAGSLSHSISFGWDSEQANAIGDVWAKLCYEIKGICKQCYDLWATCETCTCPPEVAFSYDDATSADTVARSNDCLVAVAGSGGPYSWSVAGTGFSIPSSTTGLTNTLSADGTACGTATITVTDCCGTNVTGYVRCTTGVWSVQCQAGAVDLESPACWNDAYHACDDSPGAHNYGYIYDGQSRWILFDAFASAACVERADCIGWLTSDSCYQNYPPPCGTPAQCADSLATWDCSNCENSGTSMHQKFYNRFNYSLWVCA